MQEGDWERIRKVIESFSASDSSGKWYFESKEDVVGVTIDMNPTWTVQPMTSLWDAVKNFFVEENQNDLGYHTRKDLINYLTNKGFIHFQNSMDTYRNYLYKAGYIRTVRRGVYDIENEIPTDLSISDVKTEAYGNLHELIDNFVKPLTKARIMDWRKLNLKQKDFLSEDDFKI
jgi:hypothetical protein